MKHSAGGQWIIPIDCFESLLSAVSFPLHSFSTALQHATGRITWRNPHLFIAQVWAKRFVHNFFVEQGGMILPFVGFIFSLLISNIYQYIHTLILWKWDLYKEDDTSRHSFHLFSLISNIYQYTTLFPRNEICTLSVLNKEVWYFLLISNILY